MHKACAELSRSAGQLYMAFGFLTMILAGVQCATIVTSQSLLREVDFWYIRAEVITAGVDVMQLSRPHMVQPESTSEEMGGTGMAVHPSLPSSGSDVGADGYDYRDGRRLTHVLPVSLPDVLGLPSGHQEESELALVPVPNEAEIEGGIPIAASVSLPESQLQSTTRA